MIVSAVALTLALAPAPQLKIRPLTPAAYAARCKAAATVMQEGLSIPTDGWRRLELDRRYWEERHRQAEPNAEYRARHDAAALAGDYDYTPRGQARPSRRELAQATIVSCRRIREAAG